MLRATPMPGPGDGDCFNIKKEGNGTEPVGPTLPARVLFGTSGPTVRAPEVSEGSDTKSVSGRKHGVRIGTTNTRKDWPHTGEAGRGLGKIQRSSAPVLLPYQAETSSKERHVGPRDQRVADTTSRQLITQRSLVQIQPPQPPVGKQPPDSSGGCRFLRGR